MIETVPAYSSLTVYYDLFALQKMLNGDKSSFEFIRRKLDERMALPVGDTNESSRAVDIPICYEAEFGPDLQQLAKQKNISAEELVRIHLSRSYRVYMLGFLPGFAYMGEVDERISSARKVQPTMVVAGSVGIAGRQTGIYPFQSPGGWQIIGRTPLRLFDTGRSEPSLLKAGDMVRFISISKNEFANY
jgi:inhibitor of KinA